MTNEERIVKGKFCLCTSLSLCDFHKRGGYVTHGDNVKAKFYQVGGSVRDGLLGLKSKDIDYAVEAESFEAMREAIVERGGEIFLETPAFFTIRARVPELGACDFVLCRKDGEYKDGRRPESVEPGTIYDDLARRDFTVNAIAKTEDGTIIDPHDGCNDLLVRKLKCVGSAEDRFSEDGLRMLRALRFCITKQMNLDTQITRCLQEYKFFIPRLAGVSLERIREELYRCYSYDTIITTRILFSHFQSFGEHIFMNSPQLWLKPTLEVR